MVSLFNPATNAAQNAYMGGGAPNAAAPPSAPSVATPYMAPNLFGISDAESQTPVRVRHGQFSVDSNTGDVDRGTDPTINQYGTLSQIAQVFAGADPDSIKEYQKQLYAGHFFDKSFYTPGGDMYTPGQADDASRAAFAKAAKEAAASNGKYTVDDVINNHVEAFQAMSNSGKVVKPPRLTNPEDIKASAKAKGVSVLGKTIDDSVQSEVAKRYEQKAQMEYQQAGDNGTQYYQSSASPDWIEEQLRQLMPQTYMAHHASQGLEAIANLMQSKQSPFGNLLG